MEHKPRAKMPASQRAKQFMPFTAVKGLEKAIAEQDQLLDQAEWIELGEEKVLAINKALKHLKKANLISVRFYADGKYYTIQGPVERIDLPRSVIRIEGVTIPIESIQDIRSTTKG